MKSEPIEQMMAADLAEPGGLTYALPKTLVTIKGEIDAKAPDAVTYSVSPSIVPDPTARYRLRYSASPMSDDDIALTVDKNGLLSNAKATVVDRTGDVIVAVAKTIAVFAAARAERKPPTSPYPFTQVLEVEDLLNNVPLMDGMPYQVTPASLPDAKPAAPPPCAHSVCYRTVVPLRIRIGASSEFVIHVVNPYRTEGVDLQSTALVTRTNTFTFESGLLTTVAMNKPSSALAIAKFPLTVWEAFMSATSKLFVDQTALLKAQTDLLAQRQALLVAEQALAKAREAASPQPIVGPGTSP